VLTEEHFLAFGFGQPMVGVGWKDDAMQDLDCSVEAGTRLCAKYDAATFNDDWSGNMELRFTTPRAAEFLRIIRERVKRARGRAT
jgi:hypothetical protein